MPTPRKLALPRPKDPTEEHADWLEWAALSSLSSFISWSDYQTDLRIAGADDEEVDGDENGTPFEVLIDDIVAELQERSDSCGGKAYPFEVEQDGLAHRRQTNLSVYEFLLGLTLRDNQIQSSEHIGERLFEEVCSLALGAFLDSPRYPAETRVFGFPRRLEPAGFRDALDKLCHDLGEGRGCATAPRIANQKDAKLDLVGWKRFADGRASQLIVFGQCATGANWYEKLSDLQPGKWCELWMDRSPFVIPVSAFFLPRRIERDRWEEASRYGGVLFDRCRISGLVEQLDQSLAEKVISWTSAAIQRSEAA